MAPQGSAPFSSIFYLTKRKRLSEQLLDYRNDDSYANHQYYYENLFYPSFQTESYGNSGLHKNLIYLTQDRNKFETFDGVPLDVDDGLNRGLKYLSQHSSIVTLNEVEEFSRSYTHKGRHRDKFVGKVVDIANLLDLKDSPGSESLQTDPLERDLEFSNKYVGPLNVSEVGNLIVLAMKLHESEKLDLDLEKRLEVSAKLWKNNRVPNTVSTSLISSLFKNKPYQCESCGLRFNLNDTLKRHELTHKQKPDKFWYSLEGWIHVTSKGAFGFSYTRSQVTLETFKTLLREIPTKDENVSWLRGMLFPNEPNLDDVDMKEELHESKEEVDDSKTFGTSENIGDETTLWSWGIMDSCDRVPGSSLEDQEGDREEVDSSLINQVLDSVSLNLFMILNNNAVVASYSEMSKAFCAVCRDSLEFQFDVKYNKFVCVETLPFQVDFGMVSRLFGELVPPSYLLSFENLEKLSFLDLLKKIAVIKVLSLENKSKRDLAISDWTFKYTRDLLDMETTIPRVEDVKYLDRLIKGWKNPFKLKGQAHSTCLMYSHTSCLKLVFNSHLRLAKAKVNTVIEEEVRKRVKRLSLV